MKVYRLLLYLCFACLLAGVCTPAFAKNYITRTAEYAPEMPDTFFVMIKGMTNATKKGTLDIMFSINAKGMAFECDSIEILIAPDSIIKPLVPFSMRVSEAETADSLVTWDCNIAFPYRDQFWDNDKWSLYTSRGEYGYWLVPETIRDMHAQVRMERRRIMKERAIAGSVLAAALIFCAFDIYRRRKRKNLEEKLFIEEQFASKDRINAELHDKINTLFADRWSIFNQLCNEYFNKKDAQSDNVRLSVYKELEKQIDDMRNPQSLAELEQLVNTYNDNLMQRIREQLPELSKKDIAFLTYLYSGFAPRTICLFTDIKIKNFYNRRTRLKDKILASGAPDREEFASRM